MMKSIFVKANGKFLRISIQDIHYIQAEGHYVRIVTGENSFITHFKFSQIEEFLPADGFCKIHRSYIVAIDKIQCFDHEHVSIKNQQLPITNQFYEILKSKVVIIQCKHDNEPRFLV